MERSPFVHKKGVLSERRDQALFKVIKLQKKVSSRVLILTYINFLKATQPCPLLLCIGFIILLRNTKRQFKNLLDKKKYAKMEFTVRYTRQITALFTDISIKIHTIKPRVLTRVTN